MKTLTTFIWGLFLVCIGSYQMSTHKHFDGFWDYFWFGLGLIVGIIGILKIDKSTE